MSVPVSPVLLTPDRRRRLAAVLLRGDLTTYDTTPTLAYVIDGLADALLQTNTREHTEESWNGIADQMIDRFAHRMSSAPVAR